MMSPSAEITSELIIQENACFPIGNWQMKVLSYLGQLAEDIHYFKVQLHSTEDRATDSAAGLLRVGSVEGGLDRELRLRHVLKDYKLVADLLAFTTGEAVKINLGASSENEDSAATEHQTEPRVTAPDDLSEPEGAEKTLPPEAVIQGESTADAVNENAETEDVEGTPFTSNTEYLEEEYYPTQKASTDASGRKWLLLTSFPDETNTLSDWLNADHPQKESLALIGQICQVFRYVHQREWCFVDLLPQTIQVGKPIRFYDLTSAYPVGELLPTGLVGNFYAPELSYGKNPINELMSSYTIGTLLYQVVHKRPLPQGQEDSLAIERIPRIYQLLKICLSPVPEDRFSLDQLIDLLVTTRQIVSATRIQWQIASRSTVGLSTARLHNEDNYGVRQDQLSIADPVILAVVADGMGGMAQGEVASKLAVQTILQEPFPAKFDTSEQRAEWLVSLFQKANETIAKALRDGGTTLSVVLAVAQNLILAHVGDSRIYLLRQGEIRQLSEDHSLVAMLVRSGQITEEESLEHPDRNVLTKSLGAKPKLSDGYVQDLNCWGRGLSMPLEHEDILLLCSDGVWDLISNPDFVEIFSRDRSLQSTVDQVIQTVLQRGAPDNATLVALQLTCGQEGYY